MIDLGVFERIRAINKELVYYTTRRISSESSMNYLKLKVLLQLILISALCDDKFSPVIILQSKQGVHIVNN